MKDTFIFKICWLMVRMSVKIWSCYMNRMKSMWMPWLLEPFYLIINESGLKMCKYVS